MGRKYLGELLVEPGFISLAQLNYALNMQKRYKEKLGQILVRLGYIAKDVLIEFLGKQYATPSINLYEVYREVLDENIVHMITRYVAEKYKVIPVGFKLDERTKKLVVAMGDPSNLEAIDTLEFITGYSIEPIFTLQEDLEWIILYYYHESPSRNHPYKML